MDRNEKYIPYRELPAHLDIQEGDILYIASNILKLVHIARKNEGGFDSNAFIDSIQHKLGKNGTILLPAFNYTLKSGQKFDIKKTEPITGALSLAVFRRKDFRRTTHPLHSFMVWGKYADHLVNRNNKSSFGPDSPFAFLHEKEAKMLSLDLDLQHSLAQAHYIEEMENVYYRKMKSYKFDYVDSNGHSEKKEYLLFAKKRGFVNDVNPLYNVFEKEGISKEKVLNGVSFKITYLAKAFSIIRKDIIENNGRNIHKFSIIVFCKSLIKSLLGK